MRPFVGGTDDTLSGARWWTAGRVAISLCRVYTTLPSSAASGPTVPRMTRERRYGIAEAAAACAVSAETIRRRLRAGLLPHARRDYLPYGPWRVPVSDLIAAGLNPTAGDTAPSAASGELSDELATELRTVRAELEATRVELAKAETLAAARLAELRAVREHLDDLRQIVRRYSGLCPEDVS